MNLKGLKNDFAAWILHRNRQFMQEMHLFVGVAAGR